MGGIYADSYPPRHLAGVRLFRLQAMRDSLNLGELALDLLHLCASSETLRRRRGLNGQGDLCLLQGPPSRRLG